MATKSANTIWQENNIPPLEYCSLKRASALLGCEIEDLWHWQDIGAVRFAVNLKKVQMGCGIFHPEDFHCSSLDEDEQKHLIANALITLGRNQKGFTFSCLGGPTLISHAININIECSGVFCFEGRINKNTPNEWYATGFNRCAENKYVQIFIRGDVSCTVFNEEDLLMVRDDIERVYSAIANGEFVSLEPDSGVKEPRITVHQSNMILSLLKIAGLSEDDIFNLSPANLNKKIAQLAASKGVTSPQPDKETWGKWRGRFR